MDILYKIVKFDRGTSLGIKFLIRICSMLAIIFTAYLLTIGIYLLLNSKTLLSEPLYQGQEHEEPLNTYSLKESVNYDTVQVFLKNKESSQVEYSFSVISNKLELKIVLEDEQFEIYSKEPIALTLGTCFNAESRIDLQSIKEIFNQDLKVKLKGLNNKDRKSIIEAICGKNNSIFSRMDLYSLESNFKNRFRLWNGSIQFLTFFPFSILVITLILRGGIFIWNEIKNFNKFDENGGGESLKIAIGANDNHNYDFSSNFLKNTNWVNKLDPNIFSPFVRLMSNAINWRRNGTDPVQIPGYISTLNENIEKDIKSSYSTVNYINWAIPLIGFIGTIIGISNSMNAASGVSSSLKMNQIIARTEVTNQISVAFDTTLVSLFLSLIGVLLYKSFFKMEEDNLIKAEKLAIDFSSLSKKEINQKEIDIKIRSLELELDHMRKETQTLETDIAKYKLESELSQNKITNLLNSKQLTDKILRDLEKKEMKLKKLAELKNTELGDLEIKR